MIRAAVCPEYGPPEVVRIEEQASQSLEDGQVRVRVVAAAVNYPDVLLVANQYQISVPTPFVVGSEFAGVIVEVADGLIGVLILCFTMRSPESVWRARRSTAWRYRCRQTRSAF